ILFFSRRFNMMHPHSDLTFAVLPVSLLTRLLVSALHYNTQLQGPFYQIFVASPTSNQSIKVILSNISHEPIPLVAVSSFRLSSSRTFVNDRDRLAADEHETPDVQR